MAQVIVGTDVEFRPVDRRCGRQYPVVAIRQRRDKVGQRELLREERAAQVNRIQLVRSGRVGKAVLHQIYRLGCAAAWIGEVTSPLGRRWNTSTTRVAALLFVPLLAVENEQFVFLNRTADGEAEIVALLNLLLEERIVRILRLGAGGEIIPGIQRSVAAEVENIAVPLVGAALGHDIDDRARCHAVFRTIGIAQHLEFADRFDGGIEKNGAVRACVVVVSAVDQEQVAGVRVSIDRKVNAREQALVLGIVRVGSRNARLQLGQLHEAASVQRQFTYLLARNDFAQSGVIGLHLNFTGSHRYLLGGAADLKLHIEDSRVRSVHFDAAGRSLLEVWSLHGDCEGARVQITSHILTLSIGGYRAFLSTCNTFDDHRNISNYCAGRVGYDAANRTRCFLRHQRHSKQRDDYERQEEPSTQSIHLFPHQKQISLRSTSVRSRKAPYTLSKRAMQKIRSKPYSAISVL